MRIGNRRGEIRFWLSSCDLGLALKPSRRRETLYSGVLQNYRALFGPNGADTRTYPMFKVWLAKGQAIFTSRIGIVSGNGCP